MEFIEKEYQLPVVKINFEDLKAEIEKTLTNYTGLVVTEETLPGCKAAQKELSGLRTKIDTYRKEKKKELEAPIKKFENQCKELISLIEQAEAPIKEGIKVFDDQKREKKREKALEIISEVSEKEGLNDKYRAQLTVLDKYMNLTATDKAVREDVEIRAFAIRAEQDREQERIDIIQGVIDGENARINTKLSISDFQYLIDRGIETAAIIKQVKESADKIYAAENPTKVETMDEAETEPVTAVPEKTEEPKAEPEKIYKVVIQVTETKERIAALGTFLKQRGYCYRVTEQTEV